VSEQELVSVQVPEPEPMLVLAQQLALAARSAWEPCLEPEAQLACRVRGVFLLPGAHRASGAFRVPCQRRGELAERESRSCLPTARRRSSLILGEYRENPVRDPA
jgi:hypothetical protein